MHENIVDSTTQPIIFFFFFFLQFDPALQRFMAMRATNFDHFKVTPKTTWLGFMFVVLPVGLMTYLTLKEKVTPADCACPDSASVTSSFHPSLHMHTSIFCLTFLTCMNNVSLCNLISVGPLGTSKT